MPSKADLAKIHIAKKELGLTDEEYRGILSARFGKTTAAKLTPGQSFQLINYFKAQGWKPKYQQKLPGVYSRPNDAQEGKIIALWIELHKAGVIRDRSDRALQSFVRRMTKKKKDHLRWCTTFEKHTIIEALKDWGEREGVNVD
ncbi:MAG TPA: regulatory protein GemA [Desulfobulbaceae bacterium]|nr:regulatory protein GemA [Desulfobulbaceae bacterium]